MAPPAAGVGKRGFDTAGRRTLRVSEACSFDVPHVSLGQVPAPLLLLSRTPNISQPDWTTPSST
jgi:hypothetical protein